MPTPLYIVSNPVSGSQTSLQLLQSKILPLLLLHSSRFQIIQYQTNHQGDGFRIGQQIRQKSDTLSLVIVIGGDGTTHELVNGFYSSSTAATAATPRLELVLVPTGTANALYASLYPPTTTNDTTIDTKGLQLSSLESFLSSSSSSSPSPSPSLFPLTLLSNQLNSETTVLTHLVTSHALHASILYDSDTLEMRNRYPGIERFKVAAQLNATNWISARLILNPSACQYNPNTKTFQPLSSHQHRLLGPFLYLNAMITDRLEPHFVPAPLSSTFLSETSKTPNHRPATHLDLVIIRPHRDPQVAAAILTSNSHDPPQQATAAALFASTRLVQITQAMYQGGKHIDLTYEIDDDTEPEPIVEYIRTTGYQFLPDPDNPKALLTCLDGTILRSTNTRVSVSDHASAFVWK